MQTPEDRFYNPARINGWFAVSSVLVLATTAASVLADHYDREWKGYQQKFHEMERKRAEDLVAMKGAAPASLPAEAAAIRDRLLERLPPGELKADEAAKADAAFFDASLEAVKNEPAFAAGAVLAARAYEAEAARLTTKEAEAKKAEIEAARDHAEDQRFKAEKEQREAQALVDELKFTMDHAFSQHHDAEGRIAEKEWTEAVAREKQVHSAMDGFAREKTDRMKEQRTLWAPISLMSDRARRLDEAAGVLAAEKKIGSFIAKGLRDAPLVDQFAPVTKIEQKVFPDLTVDYNFAQIGRVDRCITCHTGIDKVRVDPTTGKVTPLYTAENTPERVFRTHSRPDLFVGSTSKHSSDRIGCTVCHDGLGWGLTFNDAYHMPGTPEQEKEWKEKYHWHKGESWDFPMLPLKYVEAACFKCHKDQAQANPEDKFAKDIPAAPKWNRGLRIVEKSGCFGCHKIDGFAVAGLDKWLGEIKDHDRKGVAAATSIRKTGPSLKRVASKWNSKEAAWNWVWHPQALRPTTNMPRFFEQPNNSGTDTVTGENYDLRTRTETWGIVTYLWKESDAEWKPPAPPSKGDAARGKRLFAGLDDDGKPTGVGCVGCHNTKDFPNPQEGAPPNDFGPDLSTTGSKTSAAWLFAWLKDPSAVWHGTRMPNLRLADKDAVDLAAYLVSLRDPKWEGVAPPPLSEPTVEVLALEAARAAPEEADKGDPAAAVAAQSLEDRLKRVGKRAIAKYACFACHDIKGFENQERIGTELGGGEAWGSKDVDRLDFGLMEDSKAVEVYAKWGAKRLPHRKSEWAWLKLKNPRVYDAGLTKQPHEKLVMPNFQFTDDEADAVVTVLLSLQKGEVPAGKRRLRDAREVQAERMKWIARQYNCFGCHTVTAEERVGSDGEYYADAKGGDIRPWLGQNMTYWPPTLGGEERLPEDDPKKIRPTWAPGRVGEGTKVQAAWLFSFLRSPADPADPAKNLLRPWMSTRMPTFPFTPQELNSLVHGFAAADGVPFPFEPMQADPLGPKEHADAKELFEAMACAACHPTKGEDLNKPRSGLAPDLSHAPGRLRWEWVRLWLDNPGKLQPGTGMPANWRSGGKIRAPSGTAFKRPYFQDDPHEQMRRIADYVFTLGTPAGGAAPK